jgi:hypothetical protein
MSQLGSSAGSIRVSQVCPCPRFREATGASSNDTAKSKLDDQLRKKKLVLGEGDIPRENASVLGFARFCREDQNGKFVI